MKVKFANKVFEVLYTMEAAGLTMYAVEDEPNHIDWLTNVEVVDAESKELKKLGQSEVTKMSDQEEIAEIPFGAKDSELQEATYFIPKGFHAEIDDDKVVIKKDEKPTAWSEEDELSCFESALFTAFNDAWQSYLLGEEVNVKRWAKEQSKELLEAAKEELKGHNSAWSEEDDDDAWLNDIISKAECNLQLNKGEIDWLKSLKQRIGG